MEQAAPPGGTALPPAVAQAVAAYRGDPAAATRLARAFGRAVPPWWAYERLPAPRWRAAQALDAYASCLAEPLERRDLLADPLFRRFGRFLPPPDPRDAPGYRAVAETVCRLTGSAEAWADLQELDDLLADEAAARAWRGDDAHTGGTDVGIVRDYVREIAGSLDLTAAGMLARFAVTAENGLVDVGAGLIAWRPILEEALCVYLSLFASGVPVPAATPVPDRRNDFPHGLLRPETWVRIRLWKLRPSPYLRELVQSDNRRAVSQYASAAQNLAAAMTDRLAAESPGASRTDPDIYARLLTRWAAHDLDPPAEAWPEEAAEPGGPLDPAAAPPADPHPRTAATYQITVDSRAETITDWQSLAQVIELAVRRGRATAPGFVLGGRVEARFGRPDTVTVTGPAEAARAALLGLEPFGGAVVAGSPDGGDAWLARTAVEAARLVAGLDLATLTVERAPSPRGQEPPVPQGEPNPPGPGSVPPPDRGSTPPSEPPASPRQPPPAFPQQPELDEVRRIAGDVRALLAEVSGSLLAVAEVGEALTGFRKRLAALEERLGPAQPATPPPTDPPVADRPAGNAPPATPPLADRSAGTTPTSTPPVAARPDGIPPAVSSPMVTPRVSPPMVTPRADSVPGVSLSFNRHRAGAVRRLLQEMNGAQSRLVSLDETPVDSLRNWLPPYLSVQPDRGEEAVIALVYRSDSRLEDIETARLGYHFVDRLARVAGPAHMLSPELFASLERLIPALEFVPTEARPHVLARAQWRLVVPAGTVLGGIAGEDADDLAELAVLLAVAARDEGEPRLRRFEETLSSRDAMLRLLRRLRDLPDDRSHPDRSA